MSQRPGRGSLRVALMIVTFGGVAALLAQPPAEAPTLVIEAARVITATGAPPIVDGAVVVTGNRISYVGPRASRPATGQAQVIRLANGTVLPGFIDSHVHFRPWMTKLFIQFGVTTLLDTGNPTDVILRERDRLSKAPTTLSRLFVVGQGISGKLPGEPAGNERLLTTGAETAAATRELLDASVDAIKVHNWMPPALLTPITTEAHRANRPVLGHLGVNAAIAIESGLDVLVHSYGLDLATNDDPAVRAEIERRMPEYQARTEYYPSHLMDPRNYGRVIAVMMAHHAYFNPTFQSQFRGFLHEAPAYDAYDRIVYDQIAPAFPEITNVKDVLPYYSAPQSHPASDAQRREIEDGMRKVALFMKQFSEAGGRLVAGTDTSRLGLPGLRLHREIELWVRNGIKPMEAIRGATQYSAQMLRHEELGTLAAGKVADLLLVEGDPLKDITVTKNIVDVVKDGHLVTLVPVPRETPGSLAGVR